MALGQGNSDLIAFFLSQRKKNQFCADGDTHPSSWASPVSRFVVDEVSIIGQCTAKSNRTVNILVPLGGAFEK